MFENLSHIIARYIPGDDDYNLNRIYRLRYAVYCDEKQFIPREEIAGTVEMDEYDNGHSLHFIVTDTRDPSVEDETLGTVRLVKYSDELGFPTGKHHPALYEKLAGYDTSSIAEISRLCVAQNFRRRRDDDLYGVGSYLGGDERRKYPIVMLSLLKEMYRVSKTSGITHWISSMEDTLYRYLKSISMVFEPLDEDYIEYYGKVKSYIMDIGVAEQRLASKRSDLYQYFQC